MFSIGYLFVARPAQGNAIGCFVPQARCGAPLLNVVDLQLAPSFAASRHLASEFIPL